MVGLVAMGTVGIATDRMSLISLSLVVESCLITTTHQGQVMVLRAVVVSPVSMTTDES